MRPYQFNKMNSTQRFGCKTCGSNNHVFKDCPDNICRKCNRKGHKAIDCKVIRRTKKGLL